MRERVAITHLDSSFYTYYVLQSGDMVVSIWNNYSKPRQTAADIQKTWSLCRYTWYICTNAVLCCSMRLWIVSIQNHYTNNSWMTKWSLKREKWNSSVRPPSSGVLHKRSDRTWRCSTLHFFIVGPTRNVSIWKHYSNNSSMTKQSSKEEEVNIS